MSEDKTYVIMERMTDPVEGCYEKYEEAYEIKGDLNALGIGDLAVFNFMSDINGNVKAVDYGWKDCDDAESDDTFTMTKRDLEDYCPEMFENLYKSLNSLHLVYSRDWRENESEDIL